MTDRLTPKFAVAVTMSRQLAQKTGVTIQGEQLAIGALTLARTGTSLEETIGMRITSLRKEKGITQIELAEKLGVTQSMVSDYERGGMRLHAELIIQLTEVLDVSADELLGIEQLKKKDSSFKNRRLLRRLQAVDNLPKRDQEALLRTIDAFINK